MNVHGHTPDYYPIVGRRGTGANYNRLSIEELQSKNPRQFTLFILAFLVVQERPLTEAPFTNVFLETPAGAFGAIASIHGKPYQEWIGDKRKQLDKIADFNKNDRKDTDPVPSRFGGYCNHGAVSFPPWHRPYMLLVEQIIGTIAEELAKQIEQHNYNERNLWVPAARQLRFPYWDWAAEDVATNGLPRVLKEDKVKISMGGRNKIEVANPLSYYPYVGEIPPDFQDVESVNGVSYFSQWRRSFRYAESSPDAKRSNIQALERVLKRNVPDMRRKIALLFTFPDGEDSAKAWDEFSNTTMESKRENDQTLRGSLEGVHNNVHSYLGGNGHMSDPDYAAFDPIFFRFTTATLIDYSHCGNAYRWTQDRGTYHQVYNEQVLPRGNLAPFRTEKGEYWTSEQTRFLDPTIPGFHPKYYSYPEFEGIKVDLPANDAMRHAGRNKIAKHYGFNPRESAHRGRGTHPSFPVLREIPVGIPDGYEMIQQYRFNLTYKTPSGSEEYVGSVSVFARADHSPCAECASRRASRSVIRGVIPIPDTLVEKIISLILAAGSFEAILGNMKKGLTGELVDSTGQKLATAEGGDDAEDVPAGRSTSAKVTPLTISLLSTAIAADADDSVYMVDPNDHGDIFSHGWLATHEDSRVE